MNSNDEVMEFKHFNWTFNIKRSSNLHKNNNNTNEDNYENQYRLVKNSRIDLQDRNCYTIPVL